MSFKEKVSVQPMTEDAKRQITMAHNEPLDQDELGFWPLMAHEGSGVCIEANCLFLFVNYSTCNSLQFNMQHYIILIKLKGQWFAEGLIFLFSF